ncbi:hypothetical protein [Streptomyces sp. SM1]|uniref:hypothetical protein n=1 Tax=Streptomyces sp. SM1 TaxID=402229 RepID=UPI000CD4A9D4|nr:hypothetical protein [Streptomyces sp. SM1]
MVSSSHEALHRIFQQEPGLFARVARNLGVAFPPPVGTTQAADLWRHLMAVDLSFFQSQTAQQLRAEGEVKGQTKAVLVLLGHRGVEVGEEDRERIVGCGDTGVLDVWLKRALTARSAAEVFAPADGPGTAD